MLLFSDTNSKQIKLDMVDADVSYFPDFFSLEESKLLYQNLTEKIKWQQDFIKIYGKTIPLPRLTAWYGETDKNYSYSGILMKPHKWNSDLLLIKEKVETIAKVNFNGLLLNFYRNGVDSMGWHADNEPELGINPVIASVSFGETRLFQFKHQENSNLKSQIALENGSLLLMQGITQHKWLHQIPKTTKILKPRINLTFRVIIN
jgi:alkylated DNA repair dioxygenase AlkB